MGNHRLFAINFGCKVCDATAKAPFIQVKMSVSNAITQSMFFNKLFHIFAWNINLCKMYRIHIAQNHRNKSFSYNFRMICRRMVVSKDSTLFGRPIAQSKEKNAKTNDCSCKYKLSYNFIQTFVIFPTLMDCCANVFGWFSFSRNVCVFIFAASKQTLKLKRKCPKDEWDFFFDAIEVMYRISSVLCVCFKAVYRIDRFVYLKEVYARK